MHWRNARQNLQGSAAYAEEMLGALRRMPNITFARRWLLPRARRRYDWQGSRSTRNRSLQPWYQKMLPGRGILGSGPVPRNPAVPLLPRTDRGFGAGEDLVLGL